MKVLHQNWLTQGWIDFEYKKYVLLDYLQEVQTHFNSCSLYPDLSDLVFHYKNLTIIKENKDLMYQKFPDRVSNADLQNLTLTYQKMVEDDEIMMHINEILHFAIPEFKKHLDEGRDIYEFIEDKLELSPIGIRPLYTDHGYLFLEMDTHRDTKIYQYQITLFESAREKYRGVSTDHIETVRRGIGISHEQLKLSLIRKRKQLPNPSTFLIKSSLQFPVDESLLPIAKRLLVKYISEAA